MAIKPRIDGLLLKISPLGECVPQVSFSLRPTFASGQYFLTKPSTCGLIPITTLETRLIKKDQIEVFKMMHGYAGLNKHVFRLKNR